MNERMEHEDENSFFAFVKFHTSCLRRERLYLHSKEKFFWLFLSFCLISWGVVGYADYCAISTSNPDYVAGKIEEDVLKVPRDLAMEIFSIY